MPSATSVKATKLLTTPYLKANNLPPSANWMRHQPHLPGSATPSSTCATKKSWTHFQPALDHHNVPRRNTHTENTSSQHQAQDLRAGESESTIFVIASPAPVCWSLRRGSSILGLMIWWPSGFLKWKLHIRIWWLGTLLLRSRVGSWNWRWWRANCLLWTLIYMQHRHLFAEDCLMCVAVALIGSIRHQKERVWSEWSQSLGLFSL